MIQITRQKKYQPVRANKVRLLNSNFAFFYFHIFSKISQVKSDKMIDKWRKLQPTKNKTEKNFWPTKALTNQYNLQNFST